MSLLLRCQFSSVDDYVDGIIIQLQSEYIERFFLDGTDLQSHHVILLLQHAKNNSDLTEIALHGVTVDHQTASALLSLISTTSRKWAEVNFNFCHGEGVKIFSAPALIEHLRIHHCCMGQDDLRAIGLHLQLNNVLTKLELFDEDLSDRRLCDTFADGLAITLSLQTLDFSYCRFDGECLEVLAKGFTQNKSLVNFYFRGCDLEDERVDVLVKSLLGHPTLRNLNLFRNHCGMKGATTIASMLQKGRPTAPQNMLTLNLSYQQFERVTRLDVALISSSLVGNTTLKQLSLSSNKLNDADAELLSIGLHGNLTLQMLDLRTNNIRDAGIIAIAKHLVMCSALKWLYLFDNPFCKVGGEAILVAIQGNFEMEILNMDNKNSSYDSVQFFTYLNQAGRRILKYNNFNVALWPIVLARTAAVTIRSHGTCTNADIIYHLIHDSTLLMQEMFQNCYRDI